VARNNALAESLVRSIFAQLQNECLEEKAQYERAGQSPALQKRNYWATHIGAEPLERFIARSMVFLQNYPEFQVRPMTTEQLRFLVLLQHLVAEDTLDFDRPVRDRQHGDAFEGIHTRDGVNTQLVKDAHRAEWSIEGLSYLCDSDSLQVDGRKRRIAEFQRELVTALESFLLGFCQRRRLSADGTRKLLQAVTTQMSQCGLANLDRCSKAGKYFVSGKGLDQRINYNISFMDAVPWGETLKLSLLCLKTGFCQYQKQQELEDDENDGVDAVCTPMSCAPSSYLYQYATLRFTATSAVPGSGAKEQIECSVIDALDEAQIIEDAEA